MIYGWRMDGWMDGRAHGWMDGWAGAWMDGRMDGWVVEFSVRLMDES